ncbi:hypothetical protein BAE44_0022190 [Dichanthelium oligosanthes]|uniref:TFIIS N-terminal domain-containing protein n=1 Tax=Dichanthelium oligosanthes TaxID=888268 RepID=A0A1E5UV99_9POAL|nr:hypothetical protein BAE44_0022190 [Dichanthelium oligosanthes]
MALRRWKPFLGAFEHIDAAIEAADPDSLLSRDEFRSARARIVELLCDAAGDDEKAEGLCALLDEAMAGSLATLRAVPAERIAPCVLASGDLVGAVGALMTEHQSERVRGLARDVVRGWRAGVKDELARARAAMDVLEGLSSAPPSPPQHDTAPAADSDAKPSKEATKIPEEQPLRPRKTPVVSSRRVSTAKSYVPLSKKRAPIVISTSKTKQSANMEAPTLVRARQPKKTPPVVVSSVADEKTKMEATKRKLHDRYQEIEDAKRRRTIQVIKPPRPPPATTGQRQRINQHPAVRARGPASCAAERAFVKSCSLRMRV